MLMGRTEIEKKLTEFLEELAAVEHERWSHWQRYVHGKCQLQQDGSLLIPSELVAQWKRQMETLYDDLTEAEKQSDREQVLRYLPVVAAKLSP